MAEKHTQLSGAGLFLTRALPKANKGLLCCLATLVWTHSCVHLLARRKFAHLASLPVIGEKERARDEVERFPHTHPEAHYRPGE